MLRYHILNVYEWKFNIDKEEVLLIIIKEISHHHKSRFIDAWHRCNRLSKVWYFAVSDCLDLTSEEQNPTQHIFNCWYEHKTFFKKYEYNFFGFKYMIYVIKFTFTWKSIWNKHLKVWMLYVYNCNDRNQLRGHAFSSCDNIFQCYTGSVLNDG